MMKVVIYSCPFVPADWIAAHGLRPKRIQPRSVAGLQTTDAAFGVCTYVRAFLAEVVSDGDASAVVVTTVCDQMRRASELIARDRDLPVFLMNVPATWETAAAHRLYRDELERLGRFLVCLGAEAPARDALAAVMLDYDTRRSSLRASGGALGPRGYSEAIAAFHRTGESVPESVPTEVLGGGVPLALVGGPMLREDMAIFDLVEQAGGRIVLDGTETGERTLPAPFDRRGVRDDPLMELTRAYFGTIPDASRRPNSELYRWLEREVRDRGVRGILYRRHVWCDLWHAELHRLREWIDVPVLDLDGDDDERGGGRRAGRIQAFLEMLT